MSFDKNEDDNSDSIEPIFLTYILLDTFFSPEVMNQMKLLDKKSNKRLIKEGIRQGFKLLIVYALDGYIDAVIRNPRGLGLEPDLDYKDYWAFFMGSGRDITRTITRGNHEISKYVAKAISLLNELMALNTWQNIENYGEKTKGFRDCLRIISDETYEAIKGGEAVPIGEVLSNIVRSRLLLNACNTKLIAHRYTDYFISQGKKSDSFFPRPVPPSWALGYVFTIHEGLKLLENNDIKLKRLEELDNKVVSTENWEDVEEYDKTITKILGIPKISSGYRYKSLSKITDEKKIPLIGKIGKSVSPERLLSIMGTPAKIIESDSLRAVNNFKCLLDGAIKRSKETKEKVKVAIIKHKDDIGEEEYSIAIFMPNYGIFTNYSTWWVFYSIGYGNSKGVSPGWNEVLKKIRRNTKTIEITEEYADKDEFYKYCENPDYIRLRENIAQTNITISDIKGIFPELLIANMLTNQGYTKVINRIRPNILKPAKGEIDTLGIKHSADITSSIILFESKGQATDEDELQLEITKFSENIRKIRNNLEQFCEELNVPYNKGISVEAVFVSMGIVEEGKRAQKPVRRSLLFFGEPSVEVPDNIRFWDFDKLVEQLKKAKLPKQYIDQLKMTTVAVVINPFPVRFIEPSP